MRKRLFIDTESVAASRNLIRRFHAVEKYEQNPVLRPDLPWERAVGHNHGTVLFENDRFRFFYQTFTYAGKHGGTFQCAYAESEDGIHWEKPPLGLVEYEGSRDNNLVAFDIGGINIIRDDHETDDSRRYKLLYWGCGTNPTPGAKESFMGQPGYWGWCIAFSEDSLHWSPHPKNPVYTGADDDGSILGWDEERGQYVAFLRPLGLSRDGDQADEYVRRYPRHRKIGITLSPDCVEWGPTKSVIAPEDTDPPGTQFYSMPVFRYHGHILGLVYMHHCDPDDPLSNNHKGYMDIQLTATRDGERWERLGGPQAFMPRGNPGAFDMGMVGPNNGVVEKDGQLWFYYNGWMGEHYETKAYRRANDPGFFPMGRITSGIGLARIRVDGFVSMEAGEDDGVLTTEPESLSGEKLCLNGETRGNHAFIAAEVLDSRGKPVSGFTEADCDRFRGDKLRHELTWKGRSLSGLPAGEYSLRFILRHGSLYSYTFEG